MSLEERIKGYLYRVEEIDYIDEILSEVPRAELFQALIRLIQSPSADDVARADLFIRDVSYRANIDRSEFREQMVQVGLAAAYVQNLSARNHYIRRTALSTLTIFYDWWTQTDIEAALAFFESNDPILLSRLAKHAMFHHRWEDWSLPKRLIGSHDYLVRWSMAEVLDHILHFPLPKEEILSGAKSCLALLRQDVNQWVRAEADFLGLQVENFEIMLTLPKLEKRARSKAMNKVTPKVRFDSFGMFVARELHSLGKGDFSMPELHEFAEAFQRTG